LRARASYFSPIINLRQMLNLHTNMRPCKSYSGNPLNYLAKAVADYVGKFSKTREDIKPYFDVVDLDDHVTFGGKA
jgi:isocitrate/isopropylmalate dehydrogenase